MSSEAWGTSSSSRRQKLYVSISKTVPAPSVWETLSPGTQPNNRSGPCSWAVWLSGRRQPGNEVPPAVEHEVLREHRGTQAAPLSGSRGCGQNPGPQGGEGTRSNSGPQLSNTLPQVKGKFKHGGPKALVNKVPRQAALGKAGESYNTAHLQQGILAARISRGTMGQG